MPNQSITYQQELYRKLIHLSSLWIPVTYYFIEYKTVIIILTSAFILAIIIDIGRRKISWLQYLFNKFFRHMLREHEHSARLFTGATYFLFSSLLSVIIFSKLIAITSLAILIVADTAASLVGRRYGKTFFLSKTLEGSVAFIISGWLTIFTLGFLFQTTFKYYMIGLIAVLFGAIVEIFSAKLRIDDNFTIPLTVGFTFTFMEYLLR